MNDLNSVIIEGNLTKDPVLEKTPKGTPVCHFSVASNRYYKNEGARQEEVGFFDVEVWSRLAESCSEYLDKGHGVRVVGRLKQDRWQTPEGNSRSRVRIVGEHVEFRYRPKTGNDEIAPAETEEAAAKEAVPAY